MHRIVPIAAALIIATAIAGAEERPDIVFILTDDMRAADLEFMPNVRALLQARGATCTRYLDNVALCCPSRCAILTGQYGHDTGIEDNRHYARFHEQGEASTIAVWMQAGGYRTALFGKYLNEWTAGPDHRSVPPGWSEFCAGSDGNIYGQFNYTTTALRDGVVTLAKHGHDAADYGDDVYAGCAVDFIRRATSEHAPYFVYIAPFAPHLPATPAPRHADLFADAKAPRTPNWDEEDLGDKPAWLRGIPRLSPKDIGRIDAMYRRRLQCLQAVDEMVRDLVQTVDAAGRLDRTWFVFTSDNGFHLGNHRMVQGKWTEFEEDTHVPLIVRGPGVAAGSTIDRLIGNVDIAPTVLDLAGVAAPELVDGRSFAALLRGATPAWRSGFLLEHPGSDESPRNFTSTPYGGLHSGDWTYIEYADGERELYDDVHDPFQLANLAGDTAQATRIRLMSARMAQLRTARGSALRAIEARSLWPHGGEPWRVPGRIQAEDFDEGGEGVAFHDRDAANQGGAYRDTAVDIRACDGGFAVGWFGGGEWLSYTIDVAAAGTYDIAVRATCAGAGARMHLTCDDVDVTGPLDVPVGGRDAWRDVVGRGAALPAGIHALRLVADAGDVDVDDLVVSAAQP